MQNLNSPRLDAGGLLDSAEFDVHHTTHFTPARYPSHTSADAARLRATPSEQIASFTPELAGIMAEEERRYWQAAQASIAAQDCGATLLPVLPHRGWDGRETDYPTIPAEPSTDIGADAAESSSGPPLWLWLFGGLALVAVMLAVAAHFAN